MRFLEEVKKWLGEITEIALLLIAIGIAVEILFGASVQQNLDITGDLTIIDSSTHTWDAATSFDLTGSNRDGINHIGLQLQNNVSAYTTADGDIAWIEKKITGGSIDFSVATTVIPVPAAAWLFGSGLLGLVSVARRKKT